MKLKLAEESNIQILEITENVTSKDVEIIKAGIGTLLKKGKNRIILEVDGSNTLPDEVIRDIGFLDNLARELFGRIVIITSNALLNNKLDVFAAPPVVLCYPDRKSAIAGFASAAPLDETKKKSARAPGAATASTPTLPAALAALGDAASGKETPSAKETHTTPASATSLEASVPSIASESPTTESPTTRDAILANEVGELGTVRKELAAMKKENQILHDRLLELVENRRQAVDSAALTEKIRALEIEVEKLIVPPARLM